MTDTKYIESHPYTITPGYAEKLLTFKKPIPITVDKIQSNNEICNCGSGLKFKKCCKKK